MAYSSLVYNSSSRAMRRNQNAVRYKSVKSGLGPISETLILALIVCMFGLMYLTQITKTSKYGLEIGDLRAKQETLEETNQALKVEAARLQSLDRIKKSEVAKELVEIEDVSYANP